MYHKSRRRRQRFYPEFYADDEIEIKKEIELKLEPDLAGDAVLDVPPEGNAGDAAETLANYNDLLYPNNLKTDSVFKQLENMVCIHNDGLPTLIIAHLNPISSRDASWSRNLLVEGLSQYALSFHEPPL